MVAMMDSGCGTLHTSVYEVAPALMASMVQFHVTGRNLVPVFRGGT